MKKICMFVLFLFYSISSYAGGGMAHMYMAEKAIAKLSDPALQQLLNDNKEAYLVGAYYPDSGYVRPNTYGEDSHWDPFIYTFTDYIKEKYTDPVKQNPKLVAFLFGIAAHHIADEITHWNFYPYIENHDCPGHHKQSHNYGDLGIDLLLNIDKSQWDTHPKSWWVPVKDLVEVYKRMGKPQYTAEQIIYGNAILFLVGYAERAISAPAYLYLQWEIPWTANHYLNWPDGGMHMDEDKIVLYQNQLWDRLTKNKSIPSTEPPAQSDHSDVDSLATHQFANAVLQEGVVSVPTQKEDDGSVTLRAPVIEHINAFNAKIAELLKAITDSF